MLLYSNNKANKFFQNTSFPAINTRVQTKKYVLSQLKKEKILSFNAKIDSCLNNKKIVPSTKVLPFVIKDLQNKSFIIHILRKHHYYSKLGLKKQYFYYLLNIILAIIQTEKELVIHEVFSSFINYELLIQPTVYALKNILFFPLFQVKHENNKFVNINVELNWSRLAFFYNRIYYKKAFVYLIAKAKDNLILKFSSPLNIESLTIEKYLKFKHILNFVSSNLTLRNLFRRKYLYSILKGASTNWKINNSALLLFIHQRLFLSKQNKTSRYLWKQGSLGIQTMLRYQIKDRMFYSRFKYKQEIASSLLYSLLRIEEKKELFSFDKKKQNQLLGLRNFFLEKGYSKLKNKIKYTLSTISFLNNIRKNKKELILSKVLNTEITSASSLSNKYLFSSFLSTKDSLLKQNKVQPTTKFLWKQKKLIDNKAQISINNIHNYFSVILGQKSTVIFINALALTKFAFVYPVKKKSAQVFLNQIERELIQKYKYVAIYIQDFVRICFLSFFLKKPTFLANFMGYQIAQLPRNRKETQFVRFLIKVLKIFGAQRPEIVAVKVEFKGRVNRWRRTKMIRGMRGTISFFKYNTRIEFGSGKAITRKGALGIRLWLCYKWTFTSTLRSALLNYIQYSQYLKVKTIKRYLYQYKA